MSKRFLDKIVYRFKNGKIVTMSFTLMAVFLLWMVIFKVIPSL
jgi:hypothetical protein